MLVVLRKFKFALLLGVSCLATSAANAQQAAPRKAPVPRTTTTARSSELQAYRQAATPEVEEQPAPVRATRMAKVARPAETPIFENEDFQPPVRTVANHTRQHEAIAPVSGGCADGSCTSGTCDTGCASGNCISDCLPCNYYNQNGWYLGAEYLYTRVNYSDPAAVMTRTTVVDANNNSTVTDRTIPYDLGYQSTYRIYGGFRWGDCGESINFNFFNFNNGSTYVAPDIVQGGVIVAGHMETNPGNGERLISSLDTGVNTYDLDYSKRIPICSCNNNPCDCCDCPPWAITWGAGIRVGDVAINGRNQIFENGIQTTDATSEVTFRGVGPKIFLEGRRYFGENYRWSMYGKSTWAILVGQYDVELQKVSGTGPIATSIQDWNYRRAVPMMDLEVGFSRQIGAKTMLTAGYFMQVWWDVSTVNTIADFGNLANPNIDDSNIMAFDGFMVRLERTF